MYKITGLLVFVFALAFSALGQTKITARDLRPLEGGQWTGNLTYLDYQTKKSTSIKSNVTISRSTADKLKWTFAMQYPLEPKADRTDEVLLSADGRTFDGETVVERAKLPNGVLKIVTTKAGKDDDRDATFRHTYLISKSAFSIKKEVKYNDSDQYFERNTYSWTR